MSGGCNLSGTQPTASQAFTATTPAADMRFGAAVANAGSLMNTLGDAVVVGAPGTKGSPNSLSQILILPSTGSRLTTTASITIAGNAAGVGCQGFGSSLANAGNVNNQQRDDLLVGARFCDSGGFTDNGKAFLITSGATTNTAQVSAWTFTVSESGAEVGTVAGIGDTNNDGRPDFAVGAPLMDNANTTPTTVDAGRVYVFHGASSGLPSTTQAVSMSTSFSGHCGSAIAGGVDFNYDGIADMIVGEPSYDETSQADEGRVRVFFGRTGTMDSTADFILEGEGALRALGTSLAVGDVNDDAYGDVAIGMPRFTNAQNAEGRVLVRVGRW